MMVKQNKSEVGVALRHKKACAWLHKMFKQKIPTANLHL